jgi:hypothetical protein
MRRPWWTASPTHCVSAIASVRLGPVARAKKAGCVELSSNWKHWRCAFPQHGAGRKHERIIRLESWQDRLVNRFPAEFLTGLIHADGCRNNSPEIRGLFMFACQLLSIECRPNNPHSVSVARRASVARMDACIGRKA